MSDGMVPGVPPWVSTLIVVLVVAAGIALLILLLTRLSSARRVATPPSLSVFTDDRDADTLTRAADTAAAQADFTTAVVERFRAIIRSLDERGIIDEYPGMTALEAATLTHQALGEHGVVAALYEAAHLFDAVLYGRVVSTSAQDQQMRELADQMTTVRLPADTPSSAPPPTPRGRRHEHPHDDVAAPASPGLLSRGRPAPGDGLRPGPGAGAGGAQGSSRWPSCSSPSW